MTNTWPVKLCDYHGRYLKTPVEQKLIALMNKCLLGDGFLREVATTVKRTKSMSYKQFSVLNRVNLPMTPRKRYSGRANTGYYGERDYIESDWEINEFDLCVNGW